MNNEKTWLVVRFGFAVFVLGGIARMYMMVRLYGWSGWFSSQRNVTQKYRAVVMGHHAPAWPIGLSLICTPLGIAIMFGAILLSK
jgi:hypothetical protein